jgi:integrase
LLGNYKLAELDKTTYKRVYINELIKKYEPSTVRLFHRLFKVAINAAVDSEILPWNRFNKITIPGGQEETENFLTAVELNLFLTAAKERENITNYTMILLLSYTGLKKGEALGLTWNDVDLVKFLLNEHEIKEEHGRQRRKTVTAPF